MAQLNISKAEKIPGWMSEVELVWLAEQASKHQIILEIGSFLGRSTRALADNTPGIVYAVDHWYGPKEISMVPWEREALYDQFLSNMNGLIESRKVIPVRGNSITVQIPQMPDMVFIDGDHSYEVVKVDLERWKDVSFLCGHDASWPGVKKALEALPVEIIEQTDIWRRL